jgi:hypothetical protein
MNQKQSTLFASQTNLTCKSDTPAVVDVRSFIVDRHSGGGCSNQTKANIGLSTIFSFSHTNGVLSPDCC